MKPDIAAEIAEYKRICEDINHITDLDFCEIAKTALPATIAAYEAEKARADRAVAVLREIEWSDEVYDQYRDHVDFYCPCCGRNKEVGHLDSCLLEAALKEAEQSGS